MSLALAQPKSKQAPPPQMEEDEDAWLYPIIEERMKGPFLGHEASMALLKQILTEKELEEYSQNASS